MTVIFQSLILIFGPMCVISLMWVLWQVYTMPEHEVEALKESHEREVEFAKAMRELEKRNVN